jgi:hypothetical protein
MKISPGEVGHLAICLFLYVANLTYLSPSCFALRSLGHNEIPRSQLFLMSDTRPC